MRILLATGIYPPDIGGPATYTRTMARALKERGHEVEVVCYADEESVGGAHCCAPEDFLVHRISRSAMLPIRYAKFAWKVFIRARKMNADIVYLQGPVSEGFPGTIGAILAGKPTVMKVVGDYAWEIYQGNGGTELLDDFVTHRHTGKIRLLELIERWTVKKAKQTITPSKYLASIVEKWGVDRAKINLIYNEMNRQEKKISREEVRNKYHLDDQRVLFYGGRAVPWKHVDFIIRLLPRLPEDIVLFVGGDGPSLKFWKQEAENQHVEDRVVFLGKLDREQMFEMYHASDLFVLPSGYEGFPNVIPEAIACGLPCFVSDKGGNPETLELFGSDRVQVLAYLDELVWLKKLNEVWPSRRQGLVSGEFVSMNMVELTENILKKSL